MSRPSRLAINSIGMGGAVIPCLSNSAVTNCSMRLRRTPMSIPYSFLLATLPCESIGAPHPKVLPQAQSQAQAPGKHLEGACLGPDRLQLPMQRECGQSFV